MDTRRSYYLASKQDDFTEPASEEDLVGRVPAGGVTRRSKPRASAPLRSAVVSERLAVVIANHR